MSSPESFAGSEVQPDEEPIVEAVSPSRPELTPEEQIILDSLLRDYHKRLRAEQRLQDTTVHIRLRPGRPYNIGWKLP